MNFITRRKSIESSIALEGSHRLRQTLSWPHLIAIGVGAIVGTGIYTLTGVGAGLAGPAVVVSFLICGAICACAAFCYAEMATLIPVAGSAYTYSYAVLGETIAWVVGWSLILEYTVAAAAVAVGWAGHAEALITGAGWPVPPDLMHGAFAGGVVNLPAIAIAGIVTALLILGTRESATLNIVLVLIKLSALVLFVVLAVQSFDAAKFTPFAPFGYGATADATGRNFGVLGAAAIVFFAFYGFDTVSTAAEETKNPGRNLTIGIVGSMALCTAIYVIVATVAVGAMSYTQFSTTHDAAPLVYILQSLDHGAAAQIVAAAVVIAIPSVILVLMYGQSRIFFVMARDGLLPQRLATVSKTRGTPVLMTVLTGLVVIAMAATMDLSQIVELANVGTLTAFVAVAVSMLVLRVRDPGRPRVFRTPLPWLVGPVCILGCLYLAYSLPTRTQIWFFEWNGAGLLVYFLYGMRASKLAKSP
ncbi:MAG TPA: amino acid permease [Rhizomicrobium sp.]|jgi:APA family basic amino acid/polyamine antiporter|nr:amino acid permease [Rhizomicrobium sp.]